MVVDGFVTFVVVVLVADEFGVEFEVVAVELEFVVVVDLFVVVVVVDIVVAVVVEVVLLVAEPVPVVVDVVVVGGWGLGVVLQDSTKCSRWWRLELFVDLELMSFVHCGFL